MSEKNIGLLGCVVSILLMYSLRNVPANPRLFPLSLLILLGAASIALLVRKKPAEGRFVLGESIGSILHYVLFVAYVLVVPVFGFLPSTVVFLFIAIVALKYRRSVFVSGAVAAALAFSLQLFFSDFFRLPLP